MYYLGTTIGKVAKPLDKPMLGNDFDWSQIM